jgi:glycosyltransferase involved in cell wall biosynthesis
MKIGIYSPYLDSFGGGERYILTIAQVLSSDQQVQLLYDSHHQSLGVEKLKTDLSQRLNLDLSKISLVKAPLGPDGSFIERLSFFRDYDILIYLTDGSIFYSTAKKSFIHFQVPFKNSSAKNLLGRIKLSSWNEAIYNSEFTKKTVEKEWGIKGRVIYPPVDINQIRPLNKKKQILSVGRFNSFTRSKKHEEMIETFVQMQGKNKIPGWSLHLSGSVEGDESYLDDLRKLAGTSAVFFYPNLEFKKLMELYGESSIYWHAAGFGEDDPAKMEHFGITTVEAMAGGCVPIVINKGGQPEIVEDGKSGLLWNDLSQLEELTLKVAGDSKLRNEISLKAIERSKLFAKDKFAENFIKLINQYFAK